jgi:hypothetical protein
MSELVEADATKKTVSHNRADESMEAKVRWFQSLPLKDRMRLLCEFTDLALTINPNLARKRHAQSITGRVCVLGETPG